ncbi:MAG: diguanylate cyclase [Campylobacterales bacterium]|nr:diguanylate cyclase [Campylobacterales bacterium]
MNTPAILIVDDEPINITLLAELLRERYQIRVAPSGVKALESIQKKRPDLILLDIHMSDMDGYEVAKRLRSETHTAAIPFIFLTAKGESEAIRRGFELGAVDYITKPFNKEELLVRIDNHLKTQKLQSDLSKALFESRRRLGIIDRYIAYIKTDTQGIILEASERYCHYAHCTKEMLIGHNINVLRHTQTPKTLYEQLWAHLQEGREFSCEIENRNFEEGTNWYSVTISPEYQESGILGGYIAFYELIDEKKTIERLSQTDALTGLYNRLKLDTLIQEEHARALRYGFALSILLIDIDHFKKINDRYGHQSGDRVLVEVSALMQDATRRSDAPGRWGGEEFLIVLPHTDAAQATVLAEKLRRRIEQHDFGMVGTQSVSIGVSQLTEAMSIEALFRSADEALYRAKSEGRNRVVTL